MGIVVNVSFKLKIVYRFLLYIYIRKLEKRSVYLVKDYLCKCFKE